MLSLEHDRSLVIAVALVTSHKLCQTVNILRTVVIGHCDLLGGGAGNGTGLLRNHADTGVHGCLYFHTCSNYRSFCRQQRHCLTLHVGSHQRTVRVVVLQERNQRGSHGEYHLRGYVHIVEHMALVLLRLFAVTTGYVLVDEVSLFVQRLVRLRYMVVILLVRGHIYNLIGNTRVLRIRVVNLAVRSLHEAVLVNSCIGCKGVDQTDIRTLGSLDRTHSSVVRIVYVADLVRQLTQRVVLIHKLGQLGGTEEFLDSSRHRLNVD